MSAKIAQTEGQFMALMFQCCVGHAEVDALILAVGDRECLSHIRPDSEPISTRVLSLSRYFLLRGQGPMALQAMANLWPHRRGLCHQLHQQFQHGEGHPSPSIEPAPSYGLSIAHHDGANWRRLLDHLIHIEGIDRHAARLLLDGSTTLRIGYDGRTEMLVGGWQLEKLGARLQYQTPPGDDPVPTRVRSTLGLPLAALPAGSFRGGEGPPIEIPGGLEIAIIPITRRLYGQVMGGMRWASGDIEGDLPITDIRLCDTKVFCQRLTDIEGLKGARYRLPTEVEWQYAALAGHLRPLGHRSDWPRRIWAKASRPAAVGERLPNDWGLHDLLGNIWEWVDGPCGSRAAGVPEGQGADSRAQNGLSKGGDYSRNPEDITIFGKNVHPPGHHGLNLGFRVLRCSI